MSRRQPVLGVTKCPECRRPLDGQPVAVREVEEYPWRMSPSGHAYRSLTPVRVWQRWHAVCLARIEHDLERGRLVAAVDRAAELVEIAGQLAGATAARVASSTAAELDAARAELARFDAERIRP